MPIAVRCSACRHAFTLADHQEGKKVRCSECQAVFIAKPTRAAARRDEDEDEDQITERPRSRSGVRRKDDEPLPRRAVVARKSRDEDEDEEEERSLDDRPAGGNGVLLLVGGAVICCLLLVGGGIAAILLTRGKSTPVVVAPTALPVPAQPTGAPLVVEQPKGDPPAGVFVPPPPVGVAPPPPPAEKTPPPPARRGELTREARDKVKRATVYIRVQMADGSRASGTGFFGAPDSPNLVLTNAHVLGMLAPESQRPRTIEVFTHSGQPEEKKYGALVMGVDRSTDLAVLDIRTTEGLPAPLDVKTAANVGELDKVFVFGFPLGERLGKEITIRDSSVSSLRKNKTGALDRIQVNGGMDPGNSGGPVIDDTGSVIGVAVSGIPGRQINFAIPGERVHTILRGRFAAVGRAQSYFTSTGAIAIPITMEMIDPRNRIREVGMDLWVGNPLPPGKVSRPPGSTLPPPEPGDSPRQRFKMDYIAGVGKGDIVLPECPPGKVYWQQPYFVHGAGETRWVIATVLPPPPNPVHRKPANLVMAHRAGTKQMKLTITNSFRVGDEADAEFASLHTKATLSEQCVAPGAGGATYVLRYLKADQKMVVNKRQRPETPYSQAKALLKNFVAVLTVDGTGNLRGNTCHYQSPPPGRMVPEALLKRMSGGPELVEFHEPVKASLDALAVPLPNKTLNAGEIWKAQRMVGVDTPVGLKMTRVELTYTYVGQRKSRDGKDEAVIAISGQVRDPRLGGKVNGAALVDLATGRVFLAEVRVAIEMELLLAEPGRPPERVKVIDSLLVRLERTT